MREGGREGVHVCMCKRVILSYCLLDIAEPERCICAIHISRHIDWDVCHPASDHFTWHLVRFWIVGELIREADPVEAVRSILALLDLTQITRSRLVLSLAAAPFIQTRGFVVFSSLDFLCECFPRVKAHGSVVWEEEKKEWKLHLCGNIMRL